MARGPARAAQNQLNTENQVAKGFGDTASGIGNNSLIPFYESQLTSGFTPSETAARTNADEQINTNAASAGQKMEQGAARTRNDASLTAGEDLLAQQRGQGLATENNDILAQQEARQQAGAKGLESMYGTNIGAEESMYGMTPSTINAWNTAAQPDWMKIAGPLIGAGGQVGAAALGA
jgi:hypothetical protein